MRPNGGSMRTLPTIFRRILGDLSRPSNRIEAVLIGTDQVSGSLQNRVLLRIVRLVFRRYLQHSRYRRVVRVDQMANVLGHVLGDQDDVDVVALQERLEDLFDLRRDRVAIDHEEVLRRTLATVQLADASQQKADAGVLVVVKWCERMMRLAL